MRQVAATMCHRGVLLVAALGIVGQAGANVPDGAGLYEEFCSECHGKAAEGLTGFVDDRAQFAARLSGDTENMPDFSDFFTPDELAELYRFLRRSAADAVLSPAGPDSPAAAGVAN